MIVVLQLHGLCKVEECEDKVSLLAFLFQRAEVEWLLHTKFYFWY